MPEPISLFQIEAKIQYLITTWEMLTEGCWSREGARELRRFATDFRSQVRPLCYRELSNELDRFCLVLNELCIRRCAPTPQQCVFASICLTRLSDVSSDVHELSAYAPLDEVPGKQ